jgi:hypothetical protein
MRQRITFIPSTLLPQFKPVFNAARHREQARHLYRHLMRECTYLPDEAARVFISNEVKLRFRKSLYKRKVWLRRSHRWAEAITILQDRINAAQQALSSLSRANEGSLPSLMLVLRSTYGRVGLRRRALMKELSTPDWATSDEWFNEKLEPSYANIDSKYHYVFEPAPSEETKLTFNISPRFSKLKALASTQVRYSKLFERLSTAPMKTTAIDFPAFNIWGTPMPARRVKNLLRKRYARLMEQLFAPLPKDEWMRLKDLSIGTAQWPGPIPRRANGQLDVPENLSFRDVDRLLFVLDERDAQAELPKQFYGVHVKKMNESNIPSWMKRPEKVQEAAYQLLEQELGFATRSPVRYNKNDTPHFLTPRLMRRVWAKVFGHCPLLEKDPVSGNWDVKWGAQVLKQEMEKPVPGLGELFDMAVGRKQGCSTLSIVNDDA